MTDDPRLKELLQEGFDLEREGLPEVRPTTVGQPNLAKSEVVHVRLSEPDYNALVEAANSLGVSISDVIRSALRRFLPDYDSGREAEYLIHALHESGLRLVRRQGS